MHNASTITGPESGPEFDPESGSWLPSCLAAVMVICLCLMSAPTRAEQQVPENEKTLKDMRDKITAAEKRARKYEAQAKSLDQKITGLRQDLVLAAKKIQQAEAGVNQKEDHIDLLDRQEKSLEVALISKYNQMAKTLAAMQRLSQQPLGMVAYRPDKAVNSLRSAGLLTVLQPELKKRAEVIKRDMTEIILLREQISQERQELTGLLAALTSEQIDMNQLLQARREKHKELRLATKQERQKLKLFAAKAKSLQELIAKIEQETVERERAARAAAQRAAQKPSKDKKSARLALDSLPGGITAFHTAKGSMPMPALGAIGRRFGIRTPEGQSSEGITIHTRPQATVISPHEGRIVFAGKFRSYGQLLIISHGPEYHTLLAGMTRLDAEVGQWVLKGEPIGQMAATPNEKTAANTAAQLQTAGQNLYVELRRMGKPINPLPWIMARDRKVL